MAYFSALGGTGGTSATITVTYSEDFYGVTITATNGTTTLTKTATSSGTLTFDVSEGGTWVVSGTVEGATYSESVDVTFEYTAPPLVALPDGSTALPVNDIQMWLKCAGIRDKTTYTTLADVLADTETFIALCADSNACDYMARSTTWASGVAADSTAMLIVGKYNYCANKLLSDSTWAEAICNSTYIDSVLNIKVPTMTSATAPSGTVDSNGDYGSGYDKWRAFNPSESQGWVPNHGGAQAGYYLVGDWLSYDFGYSVCISYVELSYINTSTPNNIYFKIQGSNDNFVSDIHDLCSEQTITGVASTTVTTKVALGNATNYAKHRVYISTNSSSSGGKGLKVQFYGRTDNANYIPLVPKMTSNTTPSGECISISEYSSSTKTYLAFDGDAESTWTSASTTVPVWIGYEFPQSKIVDGVRVKFGNSSATNVSTTFKLQYSDTGNSDDWTDIGTSVTTTATAEQFYTFENSTAHLHYRIYITAQTLSNATYKGCVSILQFCKKATLPIIHSAVEDSIFYMDDGSPVALCGIPVGDTIDVDMEAFKGQTLTLVSTVAKEPTNLSNDFSMNVRITPNITEIYLMPLKSLYWWGYESDNLEEMSNANGWISWGSSNTYESPTYNKNNIDLKPSASDKVRGVASKNKIPIDKLYGIATTGGASTYGRISTIGQKTSWSGQVDVTFANTGIAKYTLNDTDQTDRYAFSINLINTSLAVNLNALWYE